VIAKINYTIKKIQNPICHKARPFTSILVMARGILIMAKSVLVIARGVLVMAENVLVMARSILVIVESVLVIARSSYG
jgi:hypothetical protein